MAPDVNTLLYSRVGLNDLRRVAEEIVNHAGKINVWLFHGEMGAGKTTLIKAIGNVLGVHDAIHSPTFSIVNEYLIQPQKKVFHFDFYRIKNEEEAYDIGTEEYFYSGYYCFVEWSEKIPGLIPERRADITITIEDNTHRTIAVSVS
jgi:tRNA threonylcarbamoyladenosine biosynthesis protein TsaE